MESRSATATALKAGKLDAGDSGSHEAAIPPAAIRSPRPVLRLLTVIAGAILIASTGSHMLVGWLHIRTTAVSPFTIGNARTQPPAYLAGSSLAGQGLEWERISRELNQRIIGWGIAGGSPFEWQIFQPRAAAVRRTFVVVSCYDLDESILCDYRAEVVPLAETIKSLKESHADWASAKRTLAQYPTNALRILFPTFARSRGIMGELRMKVSSVIHTTASGELQAGPTLSFRNDPAEEEYRSGRISDWPKAEGLRKVTAMSSAFQGGHSFAGLKHYAFKRMLECARTQGETIAVVLPVSPMYTDAFMSPESMHQFESSVSAVQNQVSGVKWMRLDQVANLRSNDYFYDLVHMNFFGQNSATDLFSSWLKQSSQL
jgi:hypothetical protein